MSHENIYFKHLKEVEDTEWLIEILSEKFDNAIDMLTNNSVVYGGAVRDALSGKDLKGDLDIAILPEDHPEIVTKFLENPRWKAMKLSPSLKKNYLGKLSLSPPTISNLSSFVNTNGMVVQLIVTASNEKDRMQAALWPARRVDIVCCGLVMLSDGRVFEVVPGALEDCKNQVLNVNKNVPIHIETLSKRINKLTSRGWKNLIDLERLSKDLERKERKKPKKKAPLTKRLVDKSSRSYMFRYGHVDGSRPLELKHTFILSKNLVDSVGLTHIIEITDRFCYKNAMPCRITINKYGDAYVECASASLASILREKIDITHACNTIPTPIRPTKATTTRSTKKSIKLSGLAYGADIVKPEVAIEPESSHFDELITTRFTELNSEHKIRAIEETWTSPTTFTEDALRVHGESYSSDDFEYEEDTVPSLKDTYISLSTKKTNTT